MRAVVTGVAGFIGSHVAEQLLDRGDSVVGIDSFTPYYDPKIKHDNLSVALSHSGLTLIDLDLARDDLSNVLDGVDVVFHLAGQPGVRASWGDGFAEYIHCNIAATQRLLEVARHAELKRFVYSSSSSIYGRAARLPTAESDLPAPISPYGVTKLAAEHLCALYGTEFGVPTTSLRYFTVYGPRQRPDMATHRVIESALGGPIFPMHGDGSQVRDFTYVDDAVHANLLAAEADLAPGTVFNIGGGSMTSLQDVIRIVESVSGKSVRLERGPRPVGDPRATGADTAAAAAELGWKPATDIAAGIERQYLWHCARRP